MVKWRVCSAPDCGELVPGGGRCPRHRPRDNRPSAAQRGYDARWRATRARVLRAHPVCEIPGCAARAEDVHHRDGLGPRGPRGHDDANLAALCHAHHSAITAQLQPGGWARDGYLENT